MVGGHSKKTRCTSRGCSELFYHKSNIIDHLNIYHQVNAHKEVLNFPNEKKFMEWKEKENLGILSTIQSSVVMEYQK